MSHSRCEIIFKVFKFLSRNPQRVWLKRSRAALLDIWRHYICLLKLPFLASLSQNFSTICLHTLSKFSKKISQKSTIVSSKANYARGLFLLFSFCGLFLLSGCFKHLYRASPYNLSQTDLLQNVEEAFKTASVIGEEIGYERWWEFFKDPQLNFLIETGLHSHPNIFLADAKIRLACYEARVAKSALFPHLFGIANVRREKVSELGEGFVPGFPDLFTMTTLKLMSSVYELDIWHKNRSLFYAALDLVHAQKADYEEAKLLLATTIASFYFDWQMQLARYEVTADRLEKKKELYSLLKQQFDAGIISEFRLYQVDSEVQLLKDLSYQISQEIEIDKHALSSLVGPINQTLCLLPAAQFNAPFPLPCTLPIDLLARRPDVMASRWRVEAASFHVKAAQANFFPRIDLMGWIGVQSVALSQLFTGKAVIAAADATATLPIFTAGKLCAELGINRERLEIAIDQYNQSLLNAVQQVSDALTNLTIADQRKISLENAFKDSTSLLDLLEQKFKNGIANKLSLLEAFENVLLQKDLLVQIQLARFEAAVELIRAIGGGYYNVCF